MTPTIEISPVGAEGLTSVTLHYTLILNRSTMEKPQMELTSLNKLSKEIEEDPR